MTVDIKSGDILTVAGIDYPIKTASVYPCKMIVNQAFTRMADVEASTKRNPGMVNGKRGEPQVHLVNVYLTPLTPADSETVQRQGLDTPTRMLETFTADEDSFCHVLIEDLVR